MVTIRRHGHEDPFARVRKSLLNDTSISWKAKGLLSYLLGKPDNWQLQEADLVNRGSDGRDAVRAGLAELEKAGYLRKEKAEKTNGKFSRNIWHISDSPEFTALDFPTRENQSHRIGFSDAENPTLSKKEETKNEVKGDKAGGAHKGGVHKPFFDLWHAAFLEVFGERYRFTAIDAATVKRLLSDTESTPESLVAVAVAAWKTDGVFVCRQAMAIRGFASNYTQIRVELRRRGALQEASPAGEEATSTREGL